MEITLLGKPVSVNQLYRGRRFLTPLGKATKMLYTVQARKQYRNKPLTEPIKLDFHAYFVSKAASDLDNVIKATLDSITGVLWKDDRQIVEMHVYKHQDKENPRVELSITT